MKILNMLFMAGLATWGFANGTVMAGDLVWEETAITTRAPASHEKIETNFVFTNTSSAPIEIQKVVTSCGCTTAKASKQIVNPKEKGTIRVIFTPGSRKGVQEKTVLVQTDQGKSVLTFRTEIADSVEVKQKVATWLVGQPADAHSFEISLTSPETKILGVETTNPHFTLELKTVQEGKKYEVLVKPKDTAEEARGTIRLLLADPNPRSIFLKAELKP